MSRRAFTLLELLVVIAVIAVIAALLLPVLGQGRIHALSIRSSQNLRQLIAANLAYAADQGCYVPADDKWNNRRWHGARTSATGAFEPAKGFLAPYLGKSREITVCPLFKELLAGRQSFEDGTGGYGYNAAYVGGTPAWSWNPDGSRRSATPAQILRPASTLMFATTAYAQPGGVQEYPYAEPPFWDFGSGATDQRPSPSIHFRFQGKALIGWCDGHVSLEEKTARPAGTNPHGGDADTHNLGWPGPDAENGWWNPQREL